MSEKYIIGIDEGSQSAKVVIFNLNGTIISKAQEELRPMSTPEVGVVEHPDDDLWEALGRASKKAMTEFSGNKQDIIGVGLCTIRFCRCLLKEDGTLASPAMSWMDERVSKPYEHHQPNVSYVTTSSGYITHRLTGEFNDTAGNYQGMWPIDTNTWDWSEDEQFFSKYNIPREMLFNLQDPGSTLGYVTKEAALKTSIPANLPVIATANDKAVEALGAGVSSENTALISLGTYIAGMVHGDKNKENAENFWTNFAAIPGNYLFESNGIRRGMWTVSWYKELFGEALTKEAKELNLSPEEMLNQEAAYSVPPGSDGLMTVLDWLSPAEAPFKKGIMIGFDGRHTRAHIYRSILEGIALTMKTNMDSMNEELNMKTEELIITGGGSNSTLLMNILANVFGLSVKRNVVNEAASLGSAISVAVGLRIYDSYEEAINQMVKVEDTFFPVEEDYEFYNRMNKEVYQYISNYTDGILKKAHSFFN